MSPTRTSLVVVSLLCALFLLPAVSSKGTLFKIKDDQGNVCGLLQTEFIINITATKGGKELGVVSFNDVDQRNFVQGDCIDTLTLNLAHTVSWTFRSYLRASPEVDWMLTRAVKFVPNKVFGPTAPSNTTELYGNHRDDVIGRPSQSYMCSWEDKSYYIKPRFTKLSSSTNQDIGYSVLVDVKFVRLQFAYVKDGKFSDPHTCDHPQ